MALDPKEVVDQFEKKKPDPNFPGRSVIETHVVHRDGSVEVWQRGQDDGPDQGTKLPGYVDPDVKKQYAADQKDEGVQTRADTAAAQASTTAAETARHNRATEAAGARTAAQTAANQTSAQSRADRTETRAITSAEAAAKVAALREERANNIAQGKLSADEADRKYDRDYRDQVETPLKRAAEARAQDAARRAEEKARTDRAQYQQEQVTAREKEETRKAEADRTFSYKAGQDAVDNAMATLPYRVGPTFGSEFSTALNTLSSGGGPVNFSPGAFSFDMPDVNAIADREVSRALSLYKTPVAPPVAPPAPVAPVVPPALATLPVASPPGLVATPATRDQWPIR